MPAAQVDTLYYLIFGYYLIHTIYGRTSLRSQPACKPTSFALPMGLNSLAFYT